MTWIDWDECAEIYVSGADPLLPENARALNLARHDVELERLEREGRL